ncbi:heterokaryon incompatibility protein-domain-containing protein [Xylariomycetidae sp. FL0641]|nr:heterokaryon incompatibility protein-domain-containing protein [Xylariomycetidae sp. FL0641]
MTCIPPAEQYSSVNLRVERFQEDNPPQYEALSYVWGPRAPPSSIRVANAQDDVVITQNLDVAPRHLRYGGRPRSLWVDAICIDQHNDSEKGEQVSFMDHLYGLLSLLPPSDAAIILPRTSAKPGVWLFSRPVTYTYGQPSWIPNWSAPHLRQRRTLASIGFTSFASSRFSAIFSFSDTGTLNVLRIYVGALESVYRLDVSEDDIAQHGDHDMAVAIRRSITSEYLSYGNSAKHGILHALARTFTCDEFNHVFIPNHFDSPQLDEAVDFLGS